MGNDLALFAVASGGSVPQWDGEQAVAGIMLRWLQRPGLGFPDYGYDLFRAEPGEPKQVSWKAVLAKGQGRTELNLAGGDLVLRSAAGLHADPGDGNPKLVVSTAAPVTIAFPDPAWYLEVGAAAGTGLTARIESNGIERDRQRLDPGGGPARWRTRGIELLHLEGDGQVDLFRYQLLHAPRDWAHLTHLCLPVSDSAYPCGPRGSASDQDVARSRVPASVDWDGRYGAEFGGLRRYLRALAVHRPASVPATLASDDGGAGEPRLGLDAEQAVAMASLDPHIARAIGIAWDDELSGFGLDGREWAYRLVARWRGSRRRVSPAKTIASNALAGSGVAISPLSAATVRDGAISLDLCRKPRLRVRNGVYEVALIAKGAAFRWRASGVSGRARQGRVRPRQGAQLVAISLDEPIERIVLRGAGRLTVTAIAIYGEPVERDAIVPSVFAAEPGPPRGPGWVEASTDQPGGAAQPIRAALRWEIALGPAADLPDRGCVLFQPARATLLADPSAPAPTPPPFEPGFVLFDGDPVLVPKELAGAVPPQPFVVDRPLEEGWHAWWVRGVDLFGRCSEPSPPRVERAVDDARPPPPALLVAEYAQADLGDEQRALRGLTPFGAAWLADHPGEDAAVVAWAWTPELEALCPDVDGFRVHVRRPAPGGGWEGSAWGPEVAAAGPLPTRLDGQVQACAAGVAALTVLAVAPIDADRSRCTTDLALDAGAGALIGAVLRGGGADHAVIGNGTGRGAELVVAHPGGAPPTPGDFELLAGTTGLTSVRTDLAPPSLSPNPHRRRVAGVMVSSESRLLLLGRRGETMVARLPTDPESGDPVGSRPGAGDPVSWYPAYAFAIADAGFGPLPGPGAAVAQAQVTVRAVRRTAHRPVVSEPAAPGLLTAVAVTPPPPPALPAIAVGERCSPLAEPADWFGVSRFAFRWNEVPGAAGYVVYRAMGDALWRADREASGVGAAHADHAFDESELPADPGRRAAALQDLAALDDALRGDEEEAIAAAYEELRSDAQQLIAAQPAVERAYVALTAAPLPASAREHRDRLDGRSAAHWFYRVAARSAAGVEGEKSPPTPPICCPDAVPPQPPRAHQALAGSGEVTLRWAPNAEADLAEYKLLRAADPGEAAEAQRMTVVARLAPSPDGPPGDGLVPPTRTGSLLEHADPAPAGREWLYRLVAIDRAGNRSAPSQLLRASSLRDLPEPPTLAAPARTATGVQLSWTHPDPRLACLVERRGPGGAGPWMAATPHGWLPRGVYAFEDTPPQPDAAWDYRVRVRDVVGQLAPVYPTANLPAA